MLAFVSCSAQSHGEALLQCHGPSKSFFTLKIGEFWRQLMQAPSLHNLTCLQSYTIT